MSLIPKLAEDTAGYSGREISKLAIAWQAGAYGSSDTKVTKEMLMRVLEENQSTKKMKKLWYSVADANNLVRDG